VIASFIARRLRAGTKFSQGLSKDVVAYTERMFWMWVLAASLLLFCFWWLQRMGWWSALVVGDPSGISLSIVVMTLATTAWVGVRAWHLVQQAKPGSDWRNQFDAWNRASNPDAQSLLAENTHGSHETAWWFASATIKLGLLGTVVGFIVMSTRIGQMASFDLDQVQGLLKQMTQGMAIALYTTLVGLLANLWLGLLLLLLDRTADRVSAAIVSDRHHCTPS
jgi:MotA/TolQ/ExbB proton channel family